MSTYRETVCNGSNCFALYLLSFLKARVISGTSENSVISGTSSESATVMDYCNIQFDSYRLEKNRMSESMSESDKVGGGREGAKVFYAVECMC